MIALLAYDVAVIAFDPFISAEDEVSFFLAVTVILLPLFCLKALVGWRAWLATWAVVLFQMTAVASLFYNFPAMRSGDGYWRWFHRI